MSVEGFYFCLKRLTFYDECFHRSSQRRDSGLEGSGIKSKDYRPWPWLFKGGVIDRGNHYPVPRAPGYITTAEGANEVFVLATRNEKPWL